jgi:hypothetical protein
MFPLLPGNWPVNKIIAVTAGSFGQSIIGTTYYELQLQWFRARANHNFRNQRAVREEGGLSNINN